MKKTMMLCLLAACLAVMSGCRVRTAAVPPEGAGSERTGVEAHAAMDRHEEDPAEPEPVEDSPRTTEAPDALRREYDASASARITGGASHELRDSGHEGGLSGEENDEDTAGRADVLREDADRTALQIVPAETSDRLGISSAAPEAESYYLYYSALLKERTGSLFECKRPDIYWETVQDHRTVFKTSPEHGVILQAGGFDVSARLLEENLTVDDGWISRKDPGLIVKVVPGNVLGRGVDSHLRAKAETEAFLARPSLGQTKAVREGKLLLISEELLTSGPMRLGAALAIAVRAFPELFEDVDIAQALKLLAEEETGRAFEGILVYAP